MGRSLPVSPIIRMFKESLNTKGVRISRDAKEEIHKKIIEFISLLSKKSWEITKSSRRKIIKREDIERAFEELLGGRRE